MLNDHRIKTNRGAYSPRTVVALPTPTEGELMSDAPARNTVDLSEYPNPVVTYLGMPVEAPRRLETLKALRPQIYSEDPPHVRMRQYWRDHESLLGDASGSA